MLRYTNCEVCKKSIFDNDFQKRDVDDINAGDPIYWANKDFNPELSDNIIFCSPEHSLQWYQENILNSKS